MSALWYTEDIIAQCPKCIFRTIGFMVSGRCANCGYREKRPAPMPYVERFRNEKKEK